MIRCPNFLNREDLYECGKPKNRTRKRLNEMVDCGMEELGLGSFGYPGVMSGLYIEMVWTYTDDQYEEYMEWAKDLISKSYS